MSLCLSPFPFRTYIVSSGTPYVSDANGVIAGVTTQQDQSDLVAAGCAVLTPPPTELIGKLIGADFNIITDQLIVPTFVNGKYRVRRITALNTSVNGMATAAGGIYSAASKGGSAIVAAGQVYTGLTNALTALDLTLNLPNLILASGTPMYLSLTTGHGSAATADLWFYGDVYV